MPVYTSEEVAKHQDESSGIWISYKNGVYDITKFVQMHPGLILLILYLLIEYFAYIVEIFIII